MVPRIVIPEMQEGIDSNLDELIPPDPKSEIVDTEADKDTGETGVSIPEAL